MVKIAFVPLANQTIVAAPNSGAPVANGFYPLYSAIDYDDSLAPGSLATIQQYQTLKFTPGNRYHSRTIRPKFASRVFQTAVADAFRPSTGFIDCNQPDVPHYGLKVFMQPPPAVTGSSGGITYQVQMTYYVKFKNVR